MLASLISAVVSKPSLLLFTAYNIILGRSYHDTDIIYSFYGSILANQCPIWRADLLDAVKGSAQPR
jgi:hypothetical protein